MGPLSRSVRFVFLLVLLVVGASATQAQTVSGNVFRDYNATGVQDSGEPGVGGISINVFDATGANVGSTLSLADGTFSAALSVGAGIDVRVELGGIPSFLAPGPFGGDSATTLFFAQSGDTGLSVGLANPGQHCPDTTDISTVCFVTGPQTTTDGVIVSLPETGGSNSAVDATLFDLPAYTEEAASNEVGAVWGLAYRSRTDVLYAGAFVKRLADLGPTSNPTTLYEIDRTGGTVSTWLTLDGVRTNPHSGGIDGWARDFDAFDDVFKEGLGDVDISEDENTLYTVDLGTRDLVTIAINADGSAGTVTRVPIVAAVFPTLSGDGCASTDDVRPYGLGVNDGTVYLGVVCSAQSSVDEGMDLPIEGPVFSGSPAYPGDTSELTGYVFAWDGAVSFSEVLSFPLDYSRGCTFQNNMAGCATSHPGLWRPWVDTYPFYDAPGLERHSAGYPQPVISDIEFDDGDMILGLNDRWGHQTGPRSITPAYPLNEPPNTEGELRSPFNAGDLLRACANGATWLIEELVDPLNTGCGTAGTSSNAGGTIITDEYYFAEGHALGTPQHGELGLGGLTQIPGRSDVISSIYDPVLTFTNELDDGGLGWFDNATGGWTKSYRLYDGDLTSPGLLLLKAAGVGDVAPFCESPPIEIGNRVWDDTIPNGLQDPGEAGLNGVTVRLFCGGAEIATTMTSNLGGLGDDGSYLFNDANVAGGVPFDTACEVRIDPADAALGGRLPTTANAAGTNDINDSDGLPVGGFLVVGFTTGGPGDNDHTFDFGFTSAMPASITVTKDASPISLPEPGGMVTYTITVTNNSATVGVTIDTLTDDVSGNLDGQGTCSVPQVIAPSGSYMCQYTVMVSGDPGDTVTCTTTASGTDDFMNPVSDDDPADVTITDVPSSIEVTKTADPTSIAEPGGPVTFTVVVTNTSTVDTVTIDSLVDDVAGDLNGQGTCSVPQVLAPSASYMCTYTGNVSGDPGDVVTCTVTASGTDDDGDPVSDDDPADVTITDVPSSIEVTKTADPTSIAEPGGPVTFTVVVTNTSTVDTVTIDSLVDDVAGDLNGQGTCSVPQVLAPSASYMCTYTGNVSGDPGDVVTCTVTASGTDDDGDPVSDDDPADVTITDVPSSIEVTKTADPISIPEPGGTVTFTVMVTNTSTVDTVTIDSLVDDVAGDLDGQGDCSVPQVLAPGESYTCSYTGNVSGMPGDIVTCTVTASGTDDDGDPVSDDDPADVTITGEPSSIEVTKTADPTSIPEPGGTVTFTVMVTNTSAVDTVTIDSLVDDVAGDLNGQGDCSVPQVLAPGESYTCSYTGNVTGDPGDVITCTVTASGTDDDGDPVSDDDPADVTITDEPSSIEVTKTADPTTVPEPGGTVTFTVMVTNTSAVDTVTIDSLVDDVAGDLDGQGDCSVPQVLAPGESYTCSYTGNVMGDPGDVVTCTVTASGTDDDGDPVSDDDPADVLIAGVAQLVATKAVIGGELVPGGTVEYEVVVTNVGAGTQNDNPGPEFEDILPEELILDDAQASSGTVSLDLGANTVRWDGSLASGESVVILIFASISVEAVGEIANQACVFSDTDNDGNNDLKGVSDDPDVGGQDDPTVIDIPPTIGIPTLSEVALLLLTAFLVVAGLGVLRRRSGHGTI